ncbi:MAG: hypothetical protein C4310_06060 [Chloroflexota bacterium]
MIRIEDARMYYSDDPVHGFDHVLRVLALAERIARAEGADLEIVRAAVLLHDIARSIEDEEAGQQDHAALAAERACVILHGHPSERVEAVCRAIRSHRFRSGPPPEMLEARVVFDADKPVVSEANLLDAMGAIGIARAFAYAGQPCSERSESNGQPLISQPDEARHGPSDEFRQKLALLRERMTTATGRALAQERHAFMEAFRFASLTTGFERLAAEARGDA